MKNFREIGRNLALLTQLGLSLIMPLLLCILACVFLMNRFDIGGWIFIPGFFFGLGASFMTAYKFYTSTSKKAHNESRTDKANFNDHL